jgi:hypothetical protein
MVAAPLRRLDGDALGFYAFRALTTWGDDTTLRHFLPRLLELVQAKEIWVDFEIILGKLSYGGWGQWPQAQREVIVEWMMSWWALELAQLDSSPDQCLCAMLRAERPMEGLLAVWRPEDVEQPMHLLSFASMVEEFSAEIGGGLNRELGFWTAEEFGRLRQWAVRPEHQLALERALLGWAMPEEFAQVVGLAHGALELARQRDEG